MFVNRLSRLVSAVLLALTVSAGTASAVTVSFDFGAGTGNTVLGPLASFSGGGLGVDVTATGGDVQQNRNQSRGLGVAGNPQGNRLAAGETLIFTFSRDIRSVTATIWSRNANDFAIEDGSGGAFGTFSLANGFSTLPAFSVSGNTLVFDPSSGNGIRVTGLSVSAVPLPAAGLMLLGAVAGLGALRRRRSARPAAA